MRLINWTPGASGVLGTSRGVVNSILVEKFPLPISLLSFILTKYFIFGVKPETEKERPWSTLPEKVWLNPSPPLTCAS